jgi:hypothetical protein
MARVRPACLSCLLDKIGIRGVEIDERVEAMSFSWRESRGEAFISGHGRLSEECLESRHLEELLGRKIRNASVEIWATGG